MIGALRFELVRLLNFRFFWVVLFFYGLVLSLTFRSSYHLASNVFGQLGNLGETVMQTPAGFLGMAYIARIFEVFLSYVMISLLVQEKEYGTLKQHFIEGLSRLSWTAGKLAIVLGLSALATVLLAVNAYVFLDPVLFTDSFPEVLDICARVFVRIVGVLTLATVAGTIAKHTIKGVFLFTIYISSGELLIGWIGSYFTERDVRSWLPYGKFSSAVPSPLSGLSALGGGESEAAPTLLMQAPVLLLYLVLLWVLIYSLMRFADTADSSG